MLIDGWDDADPQRSVSLRRWLESLGFNDWQGAKRSLHRLTGDRAQRDAFTRFAPHLLEALATAGNPDRVLATFERFSHGVNSPKDLYGFLATHPRSVEMLVRLFSGSQFLGEILLRNPEYFTDLTHLRRLAQTKSLERLYHEGRQLVEALVDPLDQMDALRRYQRREMLRIGVCDLLDLFDLKTATRQLSNLADSLVRVCLDVSAERLGLSPDALSVIGMGKLGGQELNYSSDVDFLFLAGEPTPPVVRLAEHLIDALARVTTEGFLYRVDMRLRPWGKVGPLVSSPDGFITYLEKHALQWEKQALLKARVVAGSREIGEAFLSRAQTLMFNGTAEIVRMGVFEMKQRTEAFLLQKGRTWGDVKLGEGSIRDVEFVVQFLQLAHGAQRPEILSSNTLEALARCQQNGLLAVDESRVLEDGYVFLRTIEHHLQMMDYHQTHVLPEDSQAVLSLARRLGFEGVQAGEAFIARYHQHTTAIREIYLRYVGRIEMRQPDLSPAGSEPAPEQDISQHRARMGASYTERFADAEIRRHAMLAGQLDAERLALVDARPLQDDSDWEVTIVAYDFPGELSLICGLFYVYGLDIIKGDVFTYELRSEPDLIPPGRTAAEARESSRYGRKPGRRHSISGGSSSDTRRKIVDVFTVRPVRNQGSLADLWMDYWHDLEELLRMLQAGQRREARGLLARRVGTYLIENGHAGEQAVGETVTTLFPIGIEIDNETSEKYTILRIDTPDTVGFLYEFTNALSINRVYIAQMTIDSIGQRVSDILFVTDEGGQKITDAERIREVRAATVLVKHFTHLLPFSPNPETALLHFGEFTADLFKRPNWPDELSSLERPEVLQAMARLLGVSEFLWDDFLRMQYANLYPVVKGVDALTTGKTRQQLQRELEEILAEVHAGPQPPSETASWREVLNAFKDREMFRIDMRHILGHTSEFWDFAAELTGLAEVVVNTAYHLCHEDLRSVYGSPRLDHGGICEMSVCALGKCGGQELGFASDIELLFVYAGNGITSGPQVITAAEFYEKVVQDFVRAIRARREGIFEIDLQLRPYGKAGSLAVSLDSFRRYFGPDGPAWAYERQALVKLRPIAGNLELGRQISDLRDTFVYSGEEFDTTAMRAMRERQIRHLVTGGRFNLKYSPGGLVDVEYLVQGLQMTHGHTYPGIRQTNTREAMAALAQAGLLGPDDYIRLRKAHTFLRWLIDSLRVVRGNARDVTIPAEGSEEFAFLSRRMRYGNDVTRLHNELIRYTADVQEINRRLLPS